MAPTAPRLHPAPLFHQAPTPLGLPGRFAQVLTWSTRPGSAPRAEVAAGASPKSLVFQAPSLTPPPDEEAAVRWVEFPATDIFRFHSFPQPVGLFPLQALPINVCTQGSPCSHGTLQLFKHVPLITCLPLPSPFCHCAKPGTQKSCAAGQGFSRSTSPRSLVQRTISTHAHSKRQGLAGLARSLLYCACVSLSRKYLCSSPLRCSLTFFGPPGAADCRFLRSLSFFFF